LLSFGEHDYTQTEIGQKSKLPNTVKNKTKEGMPIYSVVRALVMTLPRIQKPDSMH
jgi:hypothetical protein